MIDYYVYLHGTAHVYHGLPLLISNDDVAERLKSIFGQNTSVDDTSMKFGMNDVCRVYFQKKVVATWNSKMAAIFQDGRQFLK